MPGPVDQCSTSGLAGLDVNVFDLMRLGRFVRQHWWRSNRAIRSLHFKDLVCLHVFTCLEGDAVSLGTFSFVIRIELTGNGR